ncbi:MAG: hypothetical protein WED00_03870 [Aquisalimonadaceae bacterium]
MTARGDRREAIYEDDEDREAFLRVLGEVVADFNWVCHAYCLMTNHLALSRSPASGLLTGTALGGVATAESHQIGDSHPISNRLT